MHAPSPRSSPPLTASALATLLDGETPVGTPTTSEYGGPTRVGSPELNQDCDKVRALADGTGSGEFAPELNKKLGDEEKAQEQTICDDNNVWNVQEGLASDLEQQQPDFPEGGLRAWATVAGAVLVLLSTFGLSNSFGVFQLEYHTNQLSSYPPSAISWIGSTHLFLTFGSSILSGRLFDKGYFRWQLLFGSALWIIGMFCLSVSKTYFQIFLSHAVCLGLGVGSAFGPCLSCCATYFKRRRGVVLGCTTAGAGVGAVIFPIMLNKLFPALGFSATIRAVAYLMLGLLIVANLIMTPRTLPRHAMQPILPLLASFAREGRYWLVCIGSGLCMIGCFIPLFFISSYLKTVGDGVSPILQDYALSIMNGTACLARVTSGLIADRVGIFNTAVPFTLLLSIMVFAMLSATSNASTSVFLILFGIASGGFISLMPSTFLALANSPAELGLRSGCAFVFVAVASLIGSPISGALLSVANGSYVAPSCFGGAAALLGCACLAAARWLQSQDKKTWKV